MKDYTKWKQEKEGVRGNSAGTFGVLASPCGARSYNRCLSAGADAPPFGTLLPSVATSYMLETLCENGSIRRFDPIFSPNGLSTRVSLSGCQHNGVT